MKNDKPHTMTEQHKYHGKNKKKRKKSKKYYQDNTKCCKK